MVNHLGLVKGRDGKHSCITVTFYIAGHVDLVNATIIFRCACISARQHKERADLPDIYSLGKGGCLDICGQKFESWNTGFKCAERLK